MVESNGRPIKFGALQPQHFSDLDNIELGSEGLGIWERQDCEVRILVSIVQEVKNLSTLKIYGRLISKFCWKSFGISEQQYTALTFVPYFCKKNWDEIGIFFQYKVLLNVVILKII